MEIRGLVLLRISDAQFGKICVKVENNDDHGFQMQVTEFSTMNKEKKKHFPYLWKVTIKCESDVYEVNKSVYDCIRCIIYSAESFHKSVEVLFGSVWFKDNETAYQSIIIAFTALLTTNSMKGRVNNWSMVFFLCFFVFFHFSSKSGEFLHVAFESIEKHCPLFCFASFSLFFN